MKGLRAIFQSIWTRGRDSVAIEQQRRRLLVAQRIQQDTYMPRRWPRHGQENES